MPDLSPEMMQTINSFWPFLLMGVVFYFLLYRPQKKEQNKRSRLLDNLKKGERIVTIGGVYGTINALQDDTVTLHIADRVDITIARPAVSHYQDSSKQEAV